jgi:UDP-N-acetyl-D-glucosamine dehydrogenase
VIESTSYPGTTDEVVREILEAGRLRAGKDFYLAFLPERKDPNNAQYNTRTIPKLMGGGTADCGEAAAALYGTVLEKIVPVSSARVAEAAKLLENIYGSVNIALVNELKLRFERMGINVWEVIDAAATKPFGFTPFYPGPGLGGHCIPLAPLYLTWKRQQYDLTTRFIELVGEVNTAMPGVVIQKLADARAVTQPQRSTHTRSGCRLQARSRRYPRIASAQDHGSDDYEGRRRWILRSVRAALEALTPL